MPAVRGDRVEGEVALEEFRGRWLVLFFYPGDFTFVCPTEIRSLTVRAGEIRQRDAEVVLVSTDSVYSHSAWSATPPERGGIGTRVRGDRRIGPKAHRVRQRTAVCPAVQPAVRGDAGG
jgi:alkyl hydroperoxide reductase subunit AhpC